MYISSHPALSPKESELQALSDDTGAIRLLLHALSEKTKVEELWFGCRSRGLDRHMFLSLSSLLLQFLTQSKDHLPYLDLISIPGGLDFDSQDVVFRFHNEIKALRPQKKFQVVILDDYSNWVFDLEWLWNGSAVGWGMKSVFVKIWWSWGLGDGS